MRRTAVAWAQWLALTACAAMLAGCAGGPRPATPPPYTAASGPEPAPSSARTRAQAHLELASSYLQAERYQIALSEAQEAQAADPGFAAPYTVAAMAYAALGDQASAQAQYARALALSPKDPQVLHNLAWQECEAGQYPQAEQHFAAALAVPNPGRATTLLARGICQARAGHDDQALATLAEAHALDAENPITLYNLALLQYRHGDLDAARDNVRRLNNSTRANAQSLWLGIRVERRLGDTRAQQELAAQLQRRYADSPEARAFEEGKYDE